MSNELDVVNFTNIDNQDYEGMWGGEVVIIKAGQTKQYPRFLAEHYCKHLVNKILIRQGQDWSNDIARKPLEEKILGVVAVETEEEKPVFISGGPVDKEEFAEAPTEVSEEKPIKKTRVKKVK